MNDVIQLIPIFFNSSYIECIWPSFIRQRDYVVGVSTNDGQQWSYSYNLTLTFLTYPQILRVHPNIVPSNMDSLVLLQFNLTSLHQLEYLKLRIGDNLFDISNQIQLMNQTFVKIKMQPNLTQVNQIYNIKIIIDPATEWEYDSGSVI